MLRQAREGCLLTSIRLPSLGIPEEQKRAMSEAEVRAKLFELDMSALGYPGGTSTQAEGEYFLEQRTLAMYRLKSQRDTGRYDGLYLIGNSPVVLCEIKRYDAIDANRELDRAKQQLIDYAQSEDFAEAPPFLLLYCGKPERNTFFRRKNVADSSLLGAIEYEELPELWSWGQVKGFQLRGEFAQEEVAPERLRAILTYHLDRIENDLRGQVAQAIQIV